MKPTEEQCKTAAKWCGMATRGHVRQIDVEYPRNDWHCLEWLLSPTGRHSMEQVVIARGGDVGTSYSDYEPIHWFAHASIPESGERLYREGHARAGTAAGALVLAICDMVAEKKI